MNGLRREPRWAKLAIIHRLDKDTSGVMVFGKTPVANRGLTDSSPRRKVRKTLCSADSEKPRAEQLYGFTTMVCVGDRYLSKPGAVSGDKAETAFQVLQPDDPNRAEPPGLDSRGIAAGTALCSRRAAVHWTYPSDSGSRIGEWFSDSWR